jgi:hypothetical protein
MRDASEVQAVLRDIDTYDDAIPVAVVREYIARLATLPASTPPGDAVAWATHHEPPMLFPTQAEAAAYCDDDARPIALYATPQPAAAEVDDAMVERVRDLELWAWGHNKPVERIAAIKGDSHAG